MSACLDLHFVCAAPIDFTKDISPLFEGREADVVQKPEADENIIKDACGRIEAAGNRPAEIELLSDIGEVLESGRIVVIRLITPLCRNAGVYPQKVGRKYVWSVWVSLERFPELENGRLNLRNKSHFDYIYSAIAYVSAFFRAHWELLAVGVETEFDYCDDRAEMIRNAHNIAAWSFDERESESSFLLLRQGYHRRWNHDLNAYVFERIGE